MSASKLVPTAENPFVFPISDKVKDEVLKQDVRYLALALAQYSNRRGQGTKDSAIAYH
jgi:hypothetical protein